MVWLLAQVNIGRLVAAPDDPRVRGFMDALNPVNVLAEASPGFVWRLQSAEGDATSIRISDDERDIINVSVWSSMDALTDFVHRSDHASYLRRRRDWFEVFGSVYQALWWVPAGHRPTESEAIARIEMLAEHGPSAEAFTFSRPFPPPDDTLVD